MLRTVFMLLVPILLLAQSAPEVEIAAEPHHHLTFTNAQVRVFVAEVPPHSETLLHRHRYDYVYVALGASEVVNAVAGKDPVTVKLADGETRFAPGNFAHISRNLADRPFRVVTIDLLQDAQLRQSAAKSNSAWDEDRGLDILEGGTRDVLWVKDGVRASEIELAPAGAVPSQSHSHARPHALLLVAVSDLDLFLGDPRVHDSHEPIPPHTRLKSGAVTWLPHGFQRPIVNAGPEKAKFVTLEFP